MEDKKISWMYEEVKSHINPEDYLLGKKIDKDFEKYSGLIPKERNDVNDMIEKKARTQQEDLPVSIARQEDPLAILRLKQIKQQEQLSNPKFKAKVEKLLRKKFEKEERKAKKKQKSEKSRHRDRR